MTIRLERLERVTQKWWFYLLLPARLSSLFLYSSATGFVIAEKTVKLQPKYSPTLFETI